MCLNNQCAHSCALSEAAAREWSYGTKRTESIALAVPCWTGVGEKQTNQPQKTQTKTLSQPDFSALSPAPPLLGICCHSWCSLSQVYVNVRLHFYRAAFAWKFPNWHQSLKEVSALHFTSGFHYSTDGFASSATALALVITRLEERGHWATRPHNVQSNRHTKTC